MWQYIGRNWFRNGLPPYQGGIDNKSPLIFAIYGLSDRLFGVNYWFPRLLGIIAQTTGIYFIYKIATQLSGKKAGLISICLYGFSILWRSTGGKNVAFTESYSIAFTIIAFYYFIKNKQGRSIFLSSLFITIAMAFRVTAFFPFVFLLLANLRSNRSRVLYFLSGVAGVVFLLLVLAYLVHISPKDFIYYGFTENFGQGSATDHPLLWRFENFFNGFFYSELILFYPALLCCIFIRRIPGILWGWLLSSFIAINVIGIYATQHFKEVLPALCLINAFFYAYVVDHYQVSFRKLLIVLWILFFPKLLEPLVSLKKLVQSGSSVANDDVEYDRKQLGLWIKAHSEIHDKVYVAGYGAQIQAYSERISPSIYFNVTQTQRAKQQLFKDLDSQRPALIVIPQFDAYQNLVQDDIRQYLDKYVQHGYSLDTSMYHYSLYRLDVVR